MIGGPRCLAGQTARTENCLVTILSVLALLTLLAMVERRFTKAAWTSMDTRDAIAFSLLSLASLWMELALLPTI